jgi:hypothetical protein
MFLQDSGSFQIVLLKEALVAKGNIARDVDKKLSEWQDKAERYEASLDSARSEIDILKEDHSSTVAQAELLSTEKEGLELQRQDILDEVMEMYAEKDSAINEALSTIESMLREKEMREENIESLKDRILKHILHTAPPCQFMPSLLTKTQLQELRGSLSELYSLGKFLSSLERGNHLEKTLMG